LLTRLSVLSLCLAWLLPARLLSRLPLLPRLSLLRLGSFAGLVAGLIAALQSIRLPALTGLLAAGLLAFSLSFGQLLHPAAHRFQAR
jgi:hypothetical protein